MRIVLPNLVLRSSQAFSFTERTVKFGPLLASLAGFLILILPPQSREIYLSIIESGDVLRGGFGVAAILLFSAALHSWNSKLVNRRIDQLYPDHASLSVDRSLKGIRSFKALVCAALPPAGLLMALLAVVADLERARTQVRESGLYWLPQTASEHELLAKLQSIQIHVALSGLIVAAVALIALFHLRRLRQFDGLNGLSWLICIGVVAAPLMERPLLVEVSRVLGPLAVMGLAFITFTCFARVFLFLLRCAFAAITFGILQSSRVFGGPRLFIALSIAATATVARLFLALVELPPPLRPIPPPALSIADKELTARFDEWLNVRGITEQSQGTRAPYPVFIVAAEGGGIYATSSALKLLAALQDECTAFAEHVFAISAVSGGAIGASIFQSLAYHRPLSRAAPCAAAYSSPFSFAASAIAAGDYLSPLLASTPYDWFMKIVPYLQSDMRARALTNGFIISYDQAAKPVWSVLLDRPFNSHWTGTIAPALLLNATSVETGFRGVFSPFALDGIGEGTLFALSDLPDLLSGKSVEGRKEIRARLDVQTVIDAAVTSARFPGVLPAWPLSHRGLQLNFVDGGYADASGATTAVDVFQTLKEHIAKREGAWRPSLGAGQPSDGVRPLPPRTVLLRLILLTDNETTVDLASERGTRFRDIVAPVTALLNVRQLLARRAVKRAVSQVDPEEILKFEIDHRIFPLPLGWTLSNLSNNLVGAMLGSAQRPCVKNEAAQNDAMPAAPTLFHQVVGRNSCTHQEIIKLFGER